MKTNTFVENLKILNGKVIYDDFDINEETLFMNQKFSFKEEMLQIEFGNRFLLDVGWFPEMKENGYFRVRAIQNFNWKDPLVETNCHTLAELKNSIEELVAVIDVAQKEKKKKPTKIKNRYA